MQKLSKFMLFVLMFAVVVSPVTSWANDEVQTNTENQSNTDVCKNLDGDQATVPAGYALIDNTDCLPDVCPNIPGAQATIPVNYYIGDGECAQNVDIRFNTKDGVTLSTPNSSGKYVYDACPNVWGIQGGVPAGYTKDPATNKCKKKPAVDMCPNIDGFQKSIPKNYIKLEEGGNCVSKFKI